MKVSPLIEELEEQSQDDTFYDAEASIHSSSSEEESDDDDEGKDAAIARLEAHITRLKNSKSKSRKQVTFKSGNKDNDKNLRRRSTMSPAHPAVLLADPPHDVIGKDGTKIGYVNKMHRWLTDDEAPGDDASICTTTPDIPPQPYMVSSGKLSSINEMALIDRGANGFVGGADCVWLGGPVLPRHVAITGIDNHQIRDVPIGTVGAFSITNRGPVIMIFNEVAYTGKHHTIMSCIQMEHYHNTVDERSTLAGGLQKITTPDGFVFPLSIRNGLPYLKLRPFTTKEYDTLPHVIITSDQKWNPTVFDNDIDPSSDQFTSENPPNLHLLPHDDYNILGEYMRATNATIDPPHIPPSSVQFHDNVIITDPFTNDEIFEDALDDIPPDDDVEFKFWVPDHEYSHTETIARCIHTAMLPFSTDFDRLVSEMKLEDYDDTIPIHTASAPRAHIAAPRDYKKLQPYFAWLPTHIIQRTFENTTQYGFMPSSPDGNLFKRWKAPNPAMNVFRLNDDVLTDDIQSDTPAISGGFSRAQIFFGRNSHIIHVEPLAKKSYFLRTAPFLGAIDALTL
eukprot:CAMPEP_0168196100 /NCGR_PEP_ID=MMETSP0139_2-20121125/20298_1 /TAXON_ID=44445 /ORGANISM="Pseudo-nitzschia australis, Strain 10249 10 AB" /LENGTH=564 /DNA_ID=CAMNT_0008120177 /DNA_START=193 /DNA_END=1883 /DNA_ORIENTATION=+